MELVGNTFGATDVDGKIFGVIVPANNIIKEDYRPPGGIRLEMSGNVKTRHLEIHRNFRGWWHVVPAE